MHTVSWSPFSTSVLTHYMQLLNSFNDNFSINFGLSKVCGTSWLLKSTSACSAIAFTMRNNRERLPGDAPLPPALMNIYSEKMAGEKSGKNWLQYSHPGLTYKTARECNQMTHTVLTKSKLNVNIVNNFISIDAIKIFICLLRTGPYSNHT